MNTAHVIMFWLCLGSLGLHCAHYHFLNLIWATGAPLRTLPFLCYIPPSHGLHTLYLLILGNKAGLVLKDIVGEEFALPAATPQRKGEKWLAEFWEDRKLWIWCMFCILWTVILIFFISGGRIWKVLGHCLWGHEWLKRVFVWGVKQPGISKCLHTQQKHTVLLIFLVSSTSTR